MESTYSKYIRLFGNIFFLFLGFILLLVIIVLGLRLFFGLLSYIPWISIIYSLFILLTPLCIFGTAFLVFFKRTFRHPSASVRVISYIFFTGILLCWLGFTVYDLLTFFKHQYQSIDKYYSYNLLFLTINVFGLFAIGIMQALSLPKEVDWMDRQPKDGVH